MQGVINNNTYIEAPSLIGEYGNQSSREKERRLALITRIEIHEDQELR